MKRSLHDLSLLFDDDGKVYIIWGYQGIRMAQLNADLTEQLDGARARRSAFQAAHAGKLSGRAHTGPGAAVAVASMRILRPSSRDNASSTCRRTATSRPSSPRGRGGA